MMKRLKKWLCGLFALLIFTAYPFTASAAGDGNGEEDSELLAPYFVIQGGDGENAVDNFPLKSTDVTTNINGIIAETYVVQTYTNEGTTPINARYVFPTSSDVTVHGMKMEIGDTVVTAKIQEKEEAKATYETAKSEGKSAALLEQKRPNVFTMDVANIMPGDTARIELHYTQMISPTDGLYEFIFPTVVGPRYAEIPETGDAAEPQADSRTETEAENGGDDKIGNNGSVSPRQNATASGNLRASLGDDGWTASPYMEEGGGPLGKYHITVNLSTGVPIADISCKSHEISVAKTGDSQARITLANPEDYAGNRDFILKYRLTGEETHSGLVLTGGEEENFFMLTVQPPERFTPEEIPPREYIFVLDISGSMYGYPLETAKTLIKDLVGNLNETDRFNLVLFSNETYLLSPEALPASDRNIIAAMSMIDKQDGGGGTSMLPALKEAISIPAQDVMARSIVVITDGYISNENDIYDLINENMSSASFFAFGIGTSVNDYLIKGIAQCGMGEYFIVTDSEDAESCAENFRAYIESPLLTGITFEYDGFDVYDMATATPSILYAGKPIVLFGKWKGQPSGTITISGKAGNQEYVREIPVAEVPVDTGNEAIRYLWARTMLDKLTMFGSVRNDPAAKEEITKLGLKYNMTTPYTSFVAVIDVIRNAGGNGTDVDQALPLPLKVSNLAIGGGYTAYSEPGDVILVLTAALVPLLFLLRRIRFRKKQILP